MSERQTNDHVLKRAVPFPLTDGLSLGWTSARVARGSRYRYELSQPHGLTYRSSDSSKRFFAATPKTPPPDTATCASRLTATSAGAQSRELRLPRSRLRAHSHNLTASTIPPSRRRVAHPRCPTRPPPSPRPSTISTRMTASPGPRLTTNISWRRPTATSGSLTPS